MGIQPRDLKSSGNIDTAPIVEYGNEDECNYWIIHIFKCPQNDTLQMWHWP